MLTAEPKGYEKTDEEHEGYAAARIRKEHCPYPPGTEENDRWWKGYHDYFTDAADRRSSEREGW